MAKIKNAEMAKAISALQYITTKKTMLGLSSTLVYRPTGSPINIIRKEFSPDMGRRMINLLSLPADKAAAEVSANGKPASTSVGHILMEACLSTDRQFAAVQLFRYADFTYSPATELKLYEGADAEAISTVL